MALADMEGHITLRICNREHELNHHLGLVIQQVSRRMWFPDTVTVIDDVGVGKDHPMSGYR